MSSLWNALFKMPGAMIIAVMLISGAVKAQGHSTETPVELNRQVLELYSSGKYEQAMPIAKKLLETVERERGPTHPDTATSLNNLAALYWATGAYVKAEPLYQRALAIDEKALGPAHLDTAASLNNLAGLYEATGAYAKAEPLLQRVLAIREKALGPDYPDMAQSLTNLAALFWAQGHWSEAQDDFRRSTQIEESNAQRVLALGDESRKRAYLETLTGYTHSVVSCSLPASGRLANANSLGLQVVLQRTGRVLDVLADIYSSVRRGLSAQDQQRFNQWRETNAEYAALIFRGPGTMPAENYRALLDELKSKIEALETQLSQRVALREPGSMLVGELAHELDLQLMQPLRSHLGEARQILLSPDGMLNLLPFGVLVDEQERYLTERLQLTYLTSGRDLLRTSSTAPSRQAPIVIADPDFDLLDKTAAAPPRTGAQPTGLRER